MKTSIIPPHNPGLSKKSSHAQIGHVEPVETCLKIKASIILRRAQDDINKTFWTAEQGVGLVNRKK